MDSYTVQGKQYPLRIIRSRRKSIQIQALPEGLVVRAPAGMSDSRIRAFLEKHHRWIGIHMEKAARSRQEANEAGRLTMDEIRELADRALKEIPPRAAHYAALMGVTYGRITIRNQKSRWGSCSAKGNLNFNCLLMLCPPEVIDSVVVHELAHRLEMNHSPRFYEQVRRVFPEYDRWNRWLKENGSAIMKRMTGS